MRGIRLVIGLLATAAVLSWTGCSSRERAGKPSVLILAAASTSDAVQECATNFTRETGVAIRLSADDSGKLATQIENGIRADLFLSANEKWTDYIKEKGLAAAVKPLLGNTLVLVVPKGNPAGVSGPEDLAGTKVRRVALAGSTVPAGIYARQALTSLKLLGNLELARKIISGDNVRVTLTYVERGEAEAGIVYGTDARITDQVEVVYTFPPATHDKIVYPLVLLELGQKNDGARNFYDYLQGPAAAAVFQKYGFQTLSGQ
jgi:molybdate transport system substrate-binding protein